MTVETNPYRVSAADSTMEVSDHRSPPIPRARFSLWLIVYCYPLIAAAVFYGSWLVAWACLGRMPRPMLDDPKSIGGIMDLAYLISGLVVVTAPALVPLCFAASFFCPIRMTGNRLMQGFMLAMIYLVVGAAIFITLRTDPGRIVEWWLD